MFDSINKQPLINIIHPLIAPPPFLQITRFLNSSLHFIILSSPLPPPLCTYTLCTTCIGKKKKREEYKKLKIVPLLDTRHRWREEEEGKNERRTVRDYVRTRSNLNGKITGSRINLLNCALALIRTGPLHSILYFRINSFIIINTYRHGRCHDITTRV